MHDNNALPLAPTTLLEPVALADDEATVLAACYRIILDVAARKRAAAKATADDTISDQELSVIPVKEAHA